MSGYFVIAICSLELPKNIAPKGAHKLVMTGVRGMPPSPRLPTGILRFHPHYLAPETLLGYRLRMPVAPLGPIGLPLAREDWAAARDS